VPEVVPWWEHHFLRSFSIFSSKPPGFAWFLIVGRAHVQDTARFEGTEEAQGDVPERGVHATARRGQDSANVLNVLCLFSPPLSNHYIGVFDTERPRLCCLRTFPHLPPNCPLTIREFNALATCSNFQVGGVVVVVVVVGLGNSELMLFGSGVLRV